MKSLGIVVWGLGLHAQNRILPALSSDKNLSLVGVCSRNEEIVKECSKKWNCNGWSNSSEMLDSEIVNIVYIATPIGVHYKLARQALEAGKHVWCEKPLTCDYEETQSLVFLAKQKKKMLAEGFMYLYHPQFKRVQNYTKISYSGKVHSVVCRFGIPDLNKPSFRNDPKLCGGAFWDVASYPISAVLALFPNQFRKVVFSELKKKENSTVDNEGRAILRFSDNITAFLEWRVGASYRNEIDLWSEKSSFYTDKVLSKPENYLCIYRIRDKNGNESEEFGDITNQFKKMFYNFYNMIDSPEQITKEYDCILERARVMDEILRVADLNRK